MTYNIEQLDPPPPPEPKWVIRLEVTERERHIIQTFLGQQTNLQYRDALERVNDRTPTADHVLNNLSMSFYLAFKKP